MYRKSMLRVTQDLSVFSTLANEIPPPTSWCVKSIITPCVLSTDHVELTELSGFLDSERDVMTVSIPPHLMSDHRTIECGSVSWFIPEQPCWHSWNLSRAECGSPNIHHTTVITLTFTKKGGNFWKLGFFVISWFICLNLKVFCVSVV